MAHGCFRRTRIIFWILILIPVLPLLAGRAAAAQGQAWTFECVDCPPWFAITERSLRLDAVGNPRVAFGGDHLAYAWYDGAHWWQETADDSPGIGGASLALDGAGQPHVTYWDGSNSAVRYAWRDALGWHVETVEGGEGFWLGGGTSLDLDGEGRPHVAYVDRSHKELKHAHRDALGWHAEVVDAVSDEDYTSLAVDGDGFAHVSYASGLLKYAYQDASGWHVETATAPGLDAAYGDTSLALDREGRPYVAYFNATAVYPGIFEIRVAHRDASGWALVTVDRVSESGRLWPSLALDRSGRVHVSYYDADELVFRYAFRDADGWHPETLAGTAYGSERSSLAATADGTVHVVYEAGFLGELYYASRGPAGWHSELLEGTRRVGVDNALALDGEDRPHITYLEEEDAYNATVLYAYCDGLGWHREPVGTVGFAFSGTSLALDPEGRPQVTFPYLDLSDPEAYHSEIRYAYRDAAGWHVETVTTGQASTEHTSLGLDPEGRPHVAYYDDGLEHAYRDAGGWHVEMVDGGARAGYRPSLAVDSQGFVHIAYEDWDAFAIKHAYQDAAGWHIEVVDSARTPCYDASLALDAGDRAHVTYTCDDVPRYAYWDAGGWYTETMPFGTRTLALSGDGRAHIATGDGLPDGGLRYAYRDAQGWHAEMVAEPGNVFLDVSLAVDRRGDPHLTYAQGGIGYASGHLHADLSPSTKTAGHGVEPGGRLAYTLHLVNAGRVPTAFVLTDLLPTCMTYAPGSLWAGAGTVDAGQGITWTGTISAFGHLTATFAVTADGTLSGPIVIANVATLAGDPLGPLALEARSVVGGAARYLPVVLKGE
jgi:uncharacterized repeat protein (TIGR01451 family)